MSIRWRERLGVALVVLLMLCLAGCAAREPAVRVGQTYAVLWSYGVNLMTGGIRAQQEALTIDRIRRDGWVEAHNPGDATVWMVNLRMALAITPMERGAAHPTSSSAEHRR